MAGALIPLSEAEGETLLRWYQIQGRSLPWRKREISPWEVLVSEFLLQQTRVETVVPRYPEILATIPVPEACARLKDEELHRLWSGLGYYQRARNLRETARILLNCYNGAVPQKVEELRRLPGVGEYTAHAILALAYNLPVPVLDGNIRRVLSRRFALPEPRHRPEIVEEWFAHLYREREPRDIVSALMDLGSTLCLPRAPRCSLCPLEPWCKAKQRGEPEKYPKPRPRKDLGVEELLHYWITWGSYFLLTRRPPGLLGDRLAPLTKRGSHPPLKINLPEGRAVLRRTTPPYSHRFTHKIWSITAAHYELKGTFLAEVRDSFLVPVEREQLPYLGLPRAFLKGGAQLFPELLGYH